MSELIRGRVRYTVENNIVRVSLARADKYNGLDLPLLEGAD